MWRGMSLVCIVVLAPAVAAAHFTGRVLDAADQAPIEGAIVRAQATDAWGESDAEGNFHVHGELGPSAKLVAAKKGYFNGAVEVVTSSSGLKILLERVPTEEDPAYVEREPGFCAGCHPVQVEDWSRSAMGHAGGNAWVHDLYDGSGTDGGANGWIYVRDSLHASHAPASDCRSCHEPGAWLREPGSALQGPSAEGVGCDVCHKIADVDETKLDWPGLHPEAVRMSRPAAGHQVQYGLLGDVDFVEPAQMRASYQPQLAAEVCAVCHQDRNDPDLDGDFSDGVVSEPTYFEWKESPYADPGSGKFATCVDCHMAPTEPGKVCSTLYPPLLRDPSRVRRHDFPGTTPEFLEGAASVELAAERNGDRLDVVAKVHNDRTGHHVPTGVTIRNVILLVEAKRVEDGRVLEHVGEQVVHELGGHGDPAQGYYAGLPGKLFAKINHGPDGEGPVFYTEATGILEDTRIPADQTDETSYAFRIPAEGGTIRVEARLIYRRAFRALVDAKGWTTDGHGNDLADLAPPHFGHLMASAKVEETVPALEDTASPIAPPPPAEGGCGCGAAEGTLPLGLLALLLGIRVCAVPRTDSRDPRAG